MAGNELYQQAILDLARARIGAGRLEPADASARRDNPLCGDRIDLDLRFDGDGRISAVGHKTRGCALCEAAASLIAKAAPGHRPAELGSAFKAVTRVLAGEDPAAPAGFEEIDVFRPVAGHRSRHDCVRLPFLALEDALGKTSAD